MQQRCSLCDIGSIAPLLTNAAPDPYPLEAIALIRFNDCGSIAFQVGEWVIWEIKSVSGKLLIG